MIEAQAARLERRILRSGLGAFLVLCLGIVGNFGYTSTVRREVASYSNGARDMVDALAGQQDSSFAGVNAKLDSLLRKEEEK